MKCFCSNTFQILNKWVENCLVAYDMMMFKKLISIQITMQGSLFFHIKFNLAENCHKDVWHVFSCISATHNMLC